MYKNNGPDFSRWIYKYLFIHLANYTKKNIMQSYKIVIISFSFAPFLSTWISLVKSCPYWKLYNVWKIHLKFTAQICIFKSNIHLVSVLQNCTYHKKKHAMGQYTGSSLCAVRDEQEQIEQCAVRGEIRFLFRAIYCRG